MDPVTRNEGEREYGRNMAQTFPQSGQKGRDILAVKGKG